MPSPLACHPRSSRRSLLVSAVSSGVAVAPVVLSALLLTAPSAATAQAPGAMRRSPPSRPTGRSWGTFAQAGTQWLNGVQQDVVSQSESRGGNTATAGAHFFEGVLRASAETNPEGGNGCGWWQANCYWSATASALIWDRVTIRGGPFGGQMTWSFSIHGTGDKGRKLGNGEWDAWSNFHMGPTDERGQTITLDTGTVAYGGAMSLGDKPVTVYFAMGLGVAAWNGAWANYGNTMRFSWTLPPGATYESASGLFRPPTVAVTTTPEPATCVLLGGGLAVLGVVTARRRRVA